MHRADGTDGSGRDCSSLQHLRRSGLATNRDQLKNEKGTYSPPLRNLQFVMQIEGRHIYQF